MSADTAQAPNPPASPFKNPSYPERVHVRERKHWEGVLRHWEQMIAEAGSKLGSAPDAGRHRLYAQMLGARDQIAEAAKRLPQEVGDLYEEDKHRLELAVAALERIFRDWK